jgi:hypothetical protein
LDVADDPLDGKAEIAVETWLSVDAERACGTVVSIGLIDRDLGIGVRGDRPDGAGCVHGRHRLDFGGGNVIASIARTGIARLRRFI